MNGAPNVFNADVIVVGAGSAGSVVARRLADAGASVLLVEAGPAQRVAAVDDPARMHELWDSPFDWGYRTVPQGHAHNRRLHLPRGRAVGGSHNLNAMIWVRGNPADYDHWASLGNPGWAWEDVRPVFERIEAPDSADVSAGDPLGPLHILTGYEPSPAHRSIVEAAQQAGLPFNPDYNGASQDGVSFMQFTIHDHRRWTTADAYLGPLLEPWPDSGGFTLVTGAVVHRLLFEGGRCVGVEWEREGVLERGLAGQEVVLSAGAIGSPEILMRSGIGDAAALRSHGIAVQADLPGVGRNLQDHWLVPVIAATSRPLPPSHGLPRTQSHLFWHSRPGLPVPDLQPLHFDAPLYERWMEGPPDGVSLMAGLIRPLSHGVIRLSGASPSDPVLIDPRVLSEHADVTALAAAVRLCQEIVAAPALREGWDAYELYPGSLAETEEGLHAYIRETVVTYHHQSGTCKMGVDGQAVVDPTLRVHGVEGLWVADASIMPAVTTGNTNAPAIMIAEKAAEFVTRSARGRGAAGRDLEPAAPPHSAGQAG
ncbi:GMC family oxidoreductase N-terminal domain-containing protein [Streptosporangium sp. NPDC051022]|uniref:GMC family oxidoreductase n=1 Tax=Streptosporangium sp. NPDC051022 TaxID=3155752 RepID=UPI00343315BB